jgi:hypothetical protein
MQEIILFINMDSIMQAGMGVANQMMQMTTDLFNSMSHMFKP